MARATTGKANMKCTVLAPLHLNATSPLRGAPAAAPSETRLFPAITATQHEQIKIRVLCFLVAADLQDTGLFSVLVKKRDKASFAGPIKIHLVLLQTL